MKCATFAYDSPTDTLRLGESVDNQILEDGDIIVDIGPDGVPVGYEIQHASSKREFIAAILGESRPAAAE